MGEREQSYGEAALESVAALRNRMVAYPIRLGARAAVAAWIEALTDEEVFVIAHSAEGHTLAWCAEEAGLPLDQVEKLWDRLKHEWKVL